MNTSANYPPTGLGATLGDSASNSRVARSSRDHSIYRSTPPASFPSNVSTPSVMGTSQAESTKMVDLSTLHEIYEVLYSSPDADDNDNAAWIKENYFPRTLRGNINGGYPIESGEDLSRLYDAFKRARFLTNRVQSKWPFFDRVWKQLSHAQVNQMALGERGNATLSSSSSASNYSNSTTASDHTAQSVVSRIAAAGRLRRSLLSTAIDRTGASESTEAFATGDTSTEVTQVPHAVMAQAEPSTTPGTRPSATPPQLTAYGNINNTMSAASVPGSVLAAAEPERSSLDNIPMGSGIKRKRDPRDTMQEADRTPSRGHGYLRSKRGRGGGRGRVKKSLAVEHADFDDDADDYTPTTFGNVASHRKTGPRMVDSATEKPKTAAATTRVTRRQARLSGGDEAQTASTPGPRTSTDLGKSRNNSDVTAVDELNSDGEPTDADLFNIGFTHFRKPVASTTAPKGPKAGKLKSVAEPEKQAKQEEVETPQEPGTVEYFARVNHDGRTVEFELDEASIVGDKDLKDKAIKYAAWRAENSELAKAVSFNAWCSIKGFGG